MNNLISFFRVIILNISGIFLRLYTSSSKIKWCHNRCRPNGARNIIVQGSRNISSDPMQCSRTGGCCKWFFSQIAKRSIFGGFNDLKWLNYAYMFYNILIQAPFCLSTDRPLYKGLHMSEKFSSETINSKQTNKSTIFIISPLTGEFRPNRVCSLMCRRHHYR